MKRSLLPVLPLVAGLLLGSVAVAQTGHQAGSRLRLVHSIAADLPQTHRALAKIDGKIVVVEGSIEELSQLADHPAVQRVELAGRLRLALAEALPMVGLPAARVDRAPGGGKGVIIGVVDTGIDWAHPDFADDSGATRVEWLMDVGQPARPDAHPDLSTFDAGIWSHAELMTDDVPSRDTLGHGTHVAGIASARGASTSLEADGVAPDATLIVVRASRDDTFYLDDTDVLNGVDFVLNRAQEARAPAVVNLSLGGHSGPHDGTSLFERAIEERFSNQPGRVLVTAVGNDGDRDVHVSGLLGDSVRIPVRVPESSSTGFAIVEVWYTFEDRPVVGPAAPTVAWVEAPDGRRTDTAPLGQSVREISPSLGILAVTHGRGGENLGHVALYLQSPDGQPLPAGDYVLHLDGGAGCFDGWIATPGPFQARFVTHLNADTRLTVPATARGAIAVGATVSRNQWQSSTGAVQLSFLTGGPARFSATGPTQDGRPRPDVLAPGLLVASTLSRHAHPSTNPNSIYAATVAAGANPVLVDGEHAIASGTSMSAPFVTGAAALLLERDPTLTSEEVGGLLAATAESDASWDVRRGFGLLDIERALVAVDDRAPTPLDAAQSRVSITRDVLGPKGTAWVIVSALGTDGLPYAGAWAPEVEVSAQSGSATVGEAYLRDQTSWYIPISAGTAAGGAQVEVTINGEPVAHAPTIWFGTRGELTGPDGTLAGSGCATSPRARVRWTPWRRR